MIIRRKKSERMKKGWPSMGRTNMDFQINEKAVQIKKLKIIKKE